MSSTSANYVPARSRSAFSFVFEEREIVGVRGKGSASIHASDASITICWMTRGGIGIVRGVRLFDIFRLLTFSQGRHRGE